MELLTKAGIRTIRDLIHLADALDVSILDIIYRVEHRLESPAREE